MTAREYYNQRVVAMDDADQIHAYTVKELVRGLLGDVRAALTYNGGLVCACTTADVIDGVPTEELERDLRDDEVDTSDCPVHSDDGWNRFRVTRALAELDRWEVVS